MVKETVRQTVRQVWVLQAMFDEAKTRKQASSRGWCAVVSCFVSHIVDVEFASVATEKLKDRLHTIRVYHMTDLSSFLYQKKGL